MIVHAIIKSFSELTIKCRRDNVEGRTQMFEVFVNTTLFSGPKFISNDEGATQLVSIQFQSLHL